jgi:transcriptional regulator with XRE-family HTH domain
MEQQRLGNVGSGQALSRQDIGRLLSLQRIRIGLGQSAIAKKLGYVNVNFISMLESGSCKIPVNKVDALVDAYQISPEFSLVILQAEYPEFLDTIKRLIKSVPSIFQDAIIKNPEKEIAGIDVKTRVSLGHSIN